jgi:hypothetical protein
MGRQNLFLINMSASDDTIRFTQSEIVLSQNAKLYNKKEIMSIIEEYSCVSYDVTEVTGSQL